VQVVNASGLGGTAATAFRLARLLSARGHRMLFCVPPTGMWGKVASEAGLETSTEMTLRRGLRLPSFFRDVKYIERIVAEREVDVVHVHRSAEYWRAAVALGSAPRRTKLVRSRGVVMPLGGHFANRWLHNRRTDLVICTARVIYDMYRSLRGFDAEKVELLHDGVDLETFRPDGDGSALRSQLGIPADAPVVAVVARIHAVKGHRHLVEAAPAVVAKFPDVRFLLTGRTAKEQLAAELRARVAALGVTENFVFAGSLPDVPAVLAAADVFVLASVGSEGSSRGTLEAMAAGLPAVATSVGCLPDIVVEDQTGFLVPPGDSDRLGARIIELLSDEYLRLRMGRAARARAEENFDEQKVADRLEALYAGLLGEGES
jgi:glycosyltransferase involved in cell wall biosynthesis